MGLLIFGFFIWTFVSYSTASYHAKKRKIDVVGATLLCLILTPLIGGIILLLFPTRNNLQ